MLGTRSGLVALELPRQVWGSCRFTHISLPSHRG